MHTQYYTLLHLISAKDDSYFRLQQSRKPLKSVILAEYFAVRILYNTLRIIATK